MTSLAHAVRQALETVSAAPVLAFLDVAVKLRTERGVFLVGSSPQPERYRSASHVKKRLKQGRPGSPVDLNLSAQMLDATKGRVERDGSGGLTIRYGYLPGLSDPQAIQLARYHQELGAGRSHVKRVFVGLTDQETEQALGILRREVLKRLG